MMEAWAIRFHRRMWLAHAAHPREPQRGWRPFVWTRSPAAAEKFGSRRAAEMFVRGLATRDFAEVVPLHGGHAA